MTYAFLADPPVSSSPNLFDMLKTKINVRFIYLKQNYKNVSVLNKITLFLKIQLVLKVETT